MDAGRFLDADTFELRNSTGTPRDTYLVHDPVGDLMRQPTPLPLSSAMDGQMRGEYAAAERGIITVPSIPPGGRGVLPRIASLPGHRCKGHKHAPRCVGFRQVVRLLGPKPRQLFGFYQVLKSCDLTYCELSK